MVGERSTEACDASLVDVQSGDDIGTGISHSLIMTQTSSTDSTGGSSGRVVVAIMIVILLS